METNRLLYLINASQQGIATAEEQRELDNWYATFDRAPGLTDTLSPHELKALQQRLLDSFIQRHTPITQQHTLTRFSVFRWLSAAAALLIVGAAFGFYFFIAGKSESPEDLKIAQITDILPGYNQATLALADGRTISLDSAQSGIIIGAENIKYDNGDTLELSPFAERVPSAVSGAPDLTTHYSILTTPKGGQYQIILSDGTKVWLNAASTLKYPSRFTGTTRTVEISGEGYFEIKEQKAKPFIVKSRGQEIRVLGTEFNISAYADEPVTKTTLVNGAVRVDIPDKERSIQLWPNEQAVNIGAKLTKEKVDTQQFTSWKDGQFIFNKTELYTLMKQISRWYDVEVVYETGVKNDVFFGKIDRKANLSKVLEILKLGGVNFKLDNKKLVVKP